MAVEYEKVGHIAYVTINRPEAMNNLDPKSVEELKQIWIDVKKDDEVRVAVLTGKGPRAFCCGRDIKKTPPSRDPVLVEFFRDEVSPISEMLECDKPIIAAINGYAVGGGLELALACDLRIASKNAKFGLPEVSRGSLAGLNGTQCLPRYIPHAIAMKMLLTGELIDASEAYRIGLVSDVVDQEDLMPLATKYAERIAKNAPLSVRAAKLAAYLGKDMPLHHAIVFGHFVWGLLRDTHDRAEGFRAFLEKREAHFQGR